MSWFNKNEYKTFLKQRLKEEKKRFKVALDIEKYRIKCRSSGTNVLKRT